MTYPKSVSLTLNGVPAARWIRDSRNHLIDCAMEALSRDVPDRRYDPDLHWIVGYNVDLFVRALEQPANHALTENDAPDLVASAARRASEGQPIENLIRDYQIGFNTIWQALLDQAGEQDAEGLLRLTERTHAHQLAVITLVLRSYHGEAARLSIGERDARYAVYAALLSGNNPATAAERAGVKLAEHYLVLSLHLGGHNKPVETAAPPAVAHHRRSNTIQRGLAKHTDGDVLAVIGDPTGTALVPLPNQESDGPTHRIREALGHLDLDGDLHAGATVATVKDIPAAAAESAEVLEIAVATQRSPGVYDLTDVLIEYQLIRPGAGQRLLLQRLSPLDDHPEWEETLRSFLRNRCDRRQTATELHLHPNSVDYRLNRLADTCGFDASDPLQRGLAHAALCVRDLTTRRNRRNRTISVTRR